MRLIVLLFAAVSVLFIYQRGEEEITAHERDINQVHYHADMAMVKQDEQCHRISNGYLCHTRPAYLTSKRTF